MISQFANKPTRSVFFSLFEYDKPHFEDKLLLHQKLVLFPERTFLEAETYTYKEILLPSLNSRTYSPELSLLAKLNYIMRFFKLLNHPYLMQLLKTVF